MRQLAELLTDKDLVIAARWMGGLLVVLAAAWPLYKWYQAMFGKLVTVEAFRHRTDDLEKRIAALETYRAHAEEERQEKMARRIDELEGLLEKIRKHK